MKAPSKNEVIDFLQFYITNNKRYMLSGDYEETPNKTVSITLTTDSMDEVHQEYMNVWEEVQESVYEIECADPQNHDLCAEEYMEWDEMDEDEREDAIGDYVIEEYCTTAAIQDRIDLMYHDFHKVLQTLIEWKVEEDEWTANELPEDGLIMIDDKVGMLVGEPELAITHYEVGMWQPSIFKRHGEKEAEVNVSIEYCVDVLIDGEVCSYPLYSMEFNLSCDAKELDWETCV